MFPITSLTVATLLFLTVRLDRTRSVLRTALWVWATELLLMLLPILDFHVPYSLKADAFVALALSAGFGGYFTFRGKVRPLGPPTRDEKAWARDLKLGALLSGAGLVGSLVVILAAGIHSLSLSSLLHNLHDLRDTAHETTHFSTVTTIGQYLSGSTLLGLASIGYRPEIITPNLARLVRIQRKTTLAAFIVLTVSSLFVSGGRQAVICALVVYFIARYLRGRRVLFLNLKSVLLWPVAAMLCLFFATSWIAARQGPTFRPEQALRYLNRASYNSQIAPAARSSKGLGLLVVNVGYFSSPLPTLSYYMQQKNLPGPLLGQYSYPFTSRLVGRLLGHNVPDWSVTRRKVFSPLERNGYFGNVWATWLRDLFVDFGYVGTAIYMFTFGALLSICRNRFDCTGDIRFHVLEALAGLVFVFGAFQNVLWYSLVESSFFIGLVLIVSGSRGERQNKDMLFLEKPQRTGQQGRHKTAAVGH